LRRLLEEEDGVVSVEYALLRAMVVMTAAVAWRNLGESIIRCVSRATDVFDELLAHSPSG
jgi:Flp pilus assembly pilin Flp